MNAAAANLARLLAQDFRFVIAVRAQEERRVIEGPPQVESRDLEPLRPRVREIT